MSAFSAILPFILGLPRLVAAFSINPLFGGGVIDTRVRFALCGALLMIPAPALSSGLPVALTQGPPQVGGWLLLVALLAKETILGLAIGWVSGIVFWAVQSAGFLMDNQRGASMASGPDPLSGEETSPLGSLLFQGVAVAFFVGGGFVAFLRLIWSSYALWPAASLYPAESPGVGALFFASLTDWLTLQTLLLAGPVVAASLLADAGLGLINRFASQLNVFVLSMPIKSGLASLILVGYYAVVIGHSPGLFQTMLSQVSRLFGG
jgi:type III secretion protein T